MKKVLLRFAFFLQMMLMPVFMNVIFADPPGPPGPGGDPSGGGIPVGGPLDDGIGVLLVLGIAYGAYRIYEIWKNRKPVNEKEIL
jgi:hypothetical protein